MQSQRTDPGAFTLARSSSIASSTINNDTVSKQDQEYTPETDGAIHLECSLRVNAL